MENKVVIRSGILCLNPKVVTIMGGIVSSLYEEWQMSQKYSGFSRSLRPVQKENGVGPPPFEKLQIESCHHQITHQQGSHGNLFALHLKCFSLNLNQTFRMNNCGSLFYYTPTCCTGLS